MFKKLSRKKIIFPIVSILILLAALSPCVCDNTPGSYLPVVITPDLQAPTGRAVTYTVAASDAPAHVIAQADYVCDGTADEVQINAAIAAMAAHDAHMGGRIQLSPGQFNISDTITMNNAYTEICGQSPSLLNDSATASGGTIIYLADDSDCDMVAVTEEKCKLRNLCLNGNKANNTSVADYDAVSVTDLGYMDFFMETCYTWNVGGWGLIVDDYCVGVRVLGCTFETSGNGPANTGGGVFLTNTSGTHTSLTMSDCHFWNNENSIYLVGQVGGNIINTYTSDSNFRAIRLTSCRGINITNWTDTDTSQNGSLLLSLTNQCDISGTILHGTGNTALLYGSQENNIKLRLYECGVNTGTFHAVWLNTTSGTYSRYNTFELHVGAKNAGSGISDAIYCQDANQDYNRAIGGDFRGCEGATPVTLTGSTGWTFKDNIGYIGPGEIRTVSKPITAGAQNTVTSIQNPEAQDCAILEACVSITAAATATNPTYDMGTDDDGSGAPSDGNNLFDAIPDTAGYYRSTSNGLGGGASGVQTQPVVWNAAGGASDYVNFIIVDAAGADTAGEIYIQYMGLG